MAYVRLVDSPTVCRILPDVSYVPRWYRFDTTFKLVPARYVQEFCTEIYVPSGEHLVQNVPQGTYVAAVLKVCRILIRTILPGNCVRSHGTKTTFKF